MSEARAVLIDLDTVSRAEPVATARHITLRRLRQFAAVVGVGLLFAAGGSAPPPPPPLTEVAAVPLGPDHTLALSGDRLYVAYSDVGHPRWVVVAYDMAHGRPLWRATAYSDGQLRVGLQVVAGLLLVAGPTVTTALDAATGAARWSAPYYVSALGDGRTGLAAEEVFPTGAEVPPDSGTATRYGSATGRVYWRPPVGVLALALDLASGALLWRAELADVRRMESAVRSTDSAAAGRTAALLVVTKEGRVEVWDARTRAARPVTEVPGGERDRVALAGDLLLVRDESTLTAYQADTLRLRWTRPMGAARWLVGCGPNLLCVPVVDGTEMVDVQTGVTRWRRNDGC